MVEGQLLEENSHLNVFFIGKYFLPLYKILSKCYSVYFQFTNIGYILI